MIPTLSPQRQVCQGLSIVGSGKDLIQVEAYYHEATRFVCLLNRKGKSISVDGVFLGVLPALAAGEAKAREIFGVASA